VIDTSWPREFIAALGSIDDDTFVEPEDLEVENWLL
jgi:hypothetical protein